MIWIKWFAYVACCCLGVLFALPASADASPSVLIVRRGWHIDVGFERAQLNNILREDTKVVPARYEFFGFGDRRYLTSKHRAPAMLAALWRGRGVILLTAVSSSPEQAFGKDEVIALRLSPDQMTALQQFLASSVQRHDEKADAIGPGPYSGSWYFESTQRYSGFHTCNTWVAEALRRAGFPIRSRGTLFAGQLWRQLKRLEAREPSVAPSAHPYSQGGREPS